jgi:hypothetical protein
VGHLTTRNKLLWVSKGKLRIAEQGRRVHKVFLLWNWVRKFGWIARIFSKIDFVFSEVYLGPAFAEAPARHVWS